jgi:hypothetical protein
MMGAEIRAVPLPYSAALPAMPGGSKIRFTRRLPQRGGTSCVR